MPSKLAHNDHQTRAPKKPPAITTAFVPERLLDSDEAASIRKCYPKTLQKLARKGVVYDDYVFSSETMRGKTAVLARTT